MNIKVVIAFHKSSVTVFLSMINIIGAKNYSRKKINSPDVSQTVAEIIDDVRLHGDTAVINYERKFDRVNLSQLEVSQQEFEQALFNVGNDYISMLERAALNITEFHSQQLRSGFIISRENGAVLGQRVIPLEKAGLYVPGGTAAYPSTVLMNAIPAKIAGVKQIIIATPPEIKPEILAAAHVAGVHHVFKMGGAQAVAALAFGTESVPRVDKITGPGNVFVAEAKRQVFGQVSIDMIAGPSEILIIADENNNPSHIAADMLAQAEHDRLASSILITNSHELAEQVRREIESQIVNLPRLDIARASIDDCGAIIIVDNINEAANIANDIAPEHLEICTDDAFSLMGKIRNAGSIFIGRNSPEALGDYFAGANHTLPTMGTARFSSPLSVDDFVKTSQFICYSHDALMIEAMDIENFAKSEGLNAHANSITVRRHD